MKAACVVHGSFAVLGGAERLAIEIVEILAEMGFNVYVYTQSKGAFKPSRSNIIVKEISWFKYVPSTVNSYLALRLFYNINKKLLNTECDFVINTKYNELLIPANMLYIHYPMHAMLAVNPKERSLVEGPVLSKAVKSPYDLYLRASGIAGIKLLIDDFRKARKILFNSLYTYTIFRIGARALNLPKAILSKMQVLNPPVKIPRSEESDIHDKENIVLIRLKSIPPDDARKLLGSIVKKLNGWQILVMGYDLQKCYKSLMNLNGVKIFSDVDEDEKRKLMQKAKIYIHPVKYEHFGIIVGEALGAGCKVLVHKFTGIYYDLLQKVGPSVHRCVKTYEDWNEIPMLLTEAIEEDYDPELCNSIAKYFSEDIFRQKFKDIIKFFL